jgi:hypothetical protein
MLCPPLPRPTYEESTRLFRWFRQSWQRLYRNFKKNTYFPNLVPANFFLLKKAKWGLAGRSLDQDSIKNAWEGVARSLIAIDFATAFRSWLKCCKKCLRLGSEFVAKS